MGTFWGGIAWAKEKFICYAKWLGDLHWLVANLPARSIHWLARESLLLLCRNVKAIWHADIRYFSVYLFWDNSGKLLATLFIGAMHEMSLLRSDVGVQAQVITEQPPRIVTLSMLSYFQAYTLCKQFFLQVLWIVTLIMQLVGFYSYPDT